MSTSFLSQYNPQDIKTSMDTNLNARINAGLMQERTYINSETDWLFITFFFRTDYSLLGLLNVYAWIQTPAKNHIYNANEQDEGEKVKRNSEILDWSATSCHGTHQDQ